MERFFILIKQIINCIIVDFKITASYNIDFALGVFDPIEYLLQTLYQNSILIVN